LVGGIPTLHFGRVRGKIQIELAQVTNGQYVCGHNGQEQSIERQADGAFHLTLRWRQPPTTPITATGS